MDAAAQDVTASRAHSDPPDETLRLAFLQHRQSFVKLVKMCNEDRHVIDIAADFTRLDTDFSWPRENIGFSEGRWNTYRTLFRKLGIYDAYRSEDYPAAIFFVSRSKGLIVNGSSKGYVYSLRPLLPIRESLDNISPEGPIFFRPIAANWYLFVDFEL